MNAPGTLLALLTPLSLLAAPSAEWVVHRAHDQRETQPPAAAVNTQPIAPGAAWPNDHKFRWLRGQLTVPAELEGQPVTGDCLGLRLNCGDGGEVWFDGRLSARFDNDHPALVLLTTNAAAGQQFHLDVQVYGKVQGGDRFGEARLVRIDRQRACARLAVTVNASQFEGRVPGALVGLSQGGGMCDYDDATAAKLKAGGFKWFRMDNIFTQVLKPGPYGRFVYDWHDFDRRIDFISRIGADAILAVSYMPQVLDAVPNHERQSAPRDYRHWEELCYQAAKRCRDRGKRVAYWEVWNEVNTGWLKPGPQDTGSDAFQQLYSRALGREATDPEVVRRFEAYCKLYRATARGVRRADPEAKIGGPALASGPFEHDECGHCFHGRGFARGLMLWCRQEQLPLDFVSWHEYFQPPEVFIREAEAFRSALAELPDLERSVQSLMITEWNEAWWADRPQDHEVGAAWAANCLTRAFIPHHIDRPCFFYVKQGDRNFRGDYGLLMQNNTPKAAYNVCKIFNQLSGRWLKVTGPDGEVSCVAAWDAARSRLAIVLVNFTDRYNLARPVQLSVPDLPEAVQPGQWREWTVDATHSNAWNDWRSAELTQTGSGPITSARFERQRTLAPNSVTLIEVVKR